MSRARQMRRVARAYGRVRHEPERRIEVSGACERCRLEGGQPEHFGCFPGIAEEVIRRHGGEIVDESYDRDAWVATVVIHARTEIRA